MFVTPFIIFWNILTELMIEKWDAAFFEGTD